MSERRDWYIPYIYLPHLEGITGDALQSLITKMKDIVVTTILEDPIFKDKLEALKGIYWYYKDIINIQPFFQANMDRDFDLCMLNLDVGKLETNGVGVSPHKQAMGLAKRLTDNLSEFLHEDCNVLARINYFTEGNEFVVGLNDVDQVDHQKVEEEI